VKTACSYFKPISSHWQKRKLFSLTHQVNADVLKLQSLFGLGDVVPLVLQPDVLALKDGQLLQSVVCLIRKNKAFIKTESCVVKICGIWTRYQVFL
jgi:hypothetical protein